MPEISVIVPVYKVEKYLDICITSIINQTFKDFELILVDDGSPDRSGQICDEWSAKDNRIRVFHKANGGQSSARNLGIQMAEGELLSFVDSDDYIEAAYLEYLLSLYRHDSRVKIAACNHYVVRKSNKPNSDTRDVIVLNRHDAFESVLYNGIIDVSPWGKLYHKSVFDGLTFPEGRIYEDTYLFGELLLRTECIIYGGEPQYFYIQHNESTVNGGFSEKRLGYIDAVEHLCECALMCGEDLSDACERRRLHARMSILRYMEGCEKKYCGLRDSLRKEILEKKDVVLCLPKTPKRDKLAIKLLAMGFKPFYAAWRVYGKLR